MQTVLVIEDDAATLLGWALVLRSLSYTVLEAGSRGEAWRVCREHQGPIHLILMKAILNDDSTSEFIARLQLLCPQIRALFVSDGPLTELAGRQSTPYQYACLQKPFQLDAFVDTIGKLLSDPNKRVSFSFS
jgi:DNA-binding NtrC family response regulator